MRPIFPASSNRHSNPQWKKWNSLQGPSCAPAFKANGEKKTHRAKPEGQGARASGGGLGATMHVRVLRWWGSLELTGDKVHRAQLTNILPLPLFLGTYWQARLGLAAFLPT